MDSDAKLTDIVTNFIHEETQFPDDRDAAYLTVNRVGKPAQKGTLDFGGSEYTEADIEWIDPEKKSSDDKYGWWELDEGLYHVEFNEGLDPDGETVIFQTWKNALRNGIAHSSEVIEKSRDQLFAELQVGECGVGIKENARISEVRVL
jgi:hypothetical protein